MCTVSFQVTREPTVDVKPSLLWHIFLPPPEDSFLYGHRITLQTRKFMLIRSNLSNCPDNVSAFGSTTSPAAPAAFSCQGSSVSFRPERLCLSLPLTPVPSAVLKSTRLSFWRVVFLSESSFSFFKDFIYVCIYLFRERGTEKERERNTDVLEIHRLVASYRHVP